MPEEGRITPWKSEMRISKLETSTNDRNPEPKALSPTGAPPKAGFCHCDFGPLDLFRISGFVLRVLQEAVTQAYESGQ
jgi:hypothetical protein